MTKHKISANKKQRVVTLHMYLLNTLKPFKLLTHQVQTIFFFVFEIYLSRSNFRPFSEEEEQTNFWK